MEWAVPAAALAFVPMLLGAHYGRPLLRVTSAAMSALPRTPVGALNSVLDAASLHTEVMSSILHGVLVGRWFRPPRHAPGSTCRHWCSHTATT